MEIILKPDPFEQFSEWYAEATLVSPKYPNAMTLATASKDAKPSARVVLFKGISEGGFLFFTNYESRKGYEILQNPFAAAVFYWPILDRQVRIEGRLEKITTEESDAYFHTRPRESQLSAWASPQSQEIPDRTTLERHLEDIRKKYDGKPIPLPPFWGGFRLVAEVFEFWIELPNRRHDRFHYTLRGGKWKQSRLAP